jgi:quercetin dioxygenase-like cupin family protein
MPPFRTASLDDLERLRVGDLTWLPVRHTLGIQAFGTNAYAGEAAGDEVIEPHTEDGTGHEELYFVARGTATFTLGGETLRAPAGTYVFLPDPAVHRHALAEEPGTIVLSFGAPAGAAFEVSGWERRFRATAIRERDPEAARRLYEQAAEADPGTAWPQYDLACWHAIHGDPDEALRQLGRAIDLRGDAVREAAREDADFERIRLDPRFAALVGAA